MNNSLTTVRHRTTACMTACLLLAFCEVADSRGFGGDFGGARFGGFERGEFAERAGGGAFGGGGFGGGDVQRFGGGGVGEGHFGGGGLGSVRGSEEEANVARDWQDRGNLVGQEQVRLQGNGVNNHNGEFVHTDGAYYSRGGYYYGGSFMPFYYGGSWGGYYSGMMMGELTGMAIGASIASLPRSYSTVMVGNTPYYYSNGAYMTQQSAGSGYTLVPPPPGATVNYLPNSCSPVYLGPQVYQDCGGAFYQQIEHGWQVVVPPAGIQINHIPSGAVARDVNGTQYFEFGGVWYQPFYGGSDIIYRIVGNPKP